ncbi:hypothetical protein [Nostoc piscinale]|uniref:hypothetical protein n=1 Tax=Nostoc piscinale TaxID=224012 RepID=UPI0011873F44|nr:hypothetical protein [Nostoc piscinale]
MDFQPNCPPGSGFNDSGFPVDESGFLIFNPDIPFVPNAGFIPFDADLRAEFIENDSVFEFEDGGIRDTIAYSIIRPGETESLLSYRLDFASLGIDPNEAINNLSYILEQNLLGRTRRTEIFF